MQPQSVTVPLCTYYLGAYDDKAEAVRARERGEEMHRDFLEWYYADREARESSS